MEWVCWLTETGWGIEGYRLLVAAGFFPLQRLDLRLELWLQLGLDLWLKLGLNLWLKLGRGLWLKWGLESGLRGG